MARKATKTRLNPTVAQESRLNPPPQPWRQHVWRVLLVWLIVLTAYSNSFHAGLVFDNAKLILEDARVHQATWGNLRLLVEGQYWPHISTSGLYRPLTSLSYLFNYAVLGNGPDPEGYHWINLLLHCLNAVLVYGLGLTVLRSSGQAMALSLLWSVHPLLTESVTNIVGRADLIACLGVLAGLLCYARFSSTRAARGLGWLALMAGAQTVGLLSKESAIVLPGVLLLYDLAWPERGITKKRAWAYGALSALAGAFFLVRYRLQLRMVVNILENPLTGVDFWTARFTAIKVIGKFLFEFVWPARLSADYSASAIPLFGWSLTSWEDLKTIAALAICAAALWLCWTIRRSRPPLFFFAGLFFVALAPVSNLVVLIGSIMAERFLYLPAVGLMGCVVYAGAWLSRRLEAPKLSMLLAGLATLVLAVRTYQRNIDWRDDVSLWTSAVDAYPANARAQYNLGTALLLARGPVPEAIAPIRKRLPGLRRPGVLWEAHYNLGNIFVALPGRVPDAIREYRSALRIKPDFAEGHTNLGLALAMNGELSEAVAETETAVRLQPDDAKAHYNLGNVLFKAPNRMPDAIREWESAARLEPGFAEAHYNLGIVLATQSGRLPQAISELETTVRLRPANADARYKLAQALIQVPGRETDANAQLEAAIQIQPNPTEQARFNQLQDDTVRQRSRRR